MKRSAIFHIRWNMIFILIISATFQLNAQTGPYDFPPKWHFGNRAGIDFTVPTPGVLLGGMTDAWTTLSTVEGATNVCDPNGNIVFYTDGYRLYDQYHNEVALLNGATSSTQTAVAVPDPADPDNQYYLFTANVDPGGGGDRGPDGNLGISWYRIRNNGANISIIGGPVQIAANNQVTEQLCAGVDGNGNYWIVAHEGGNFDWQNWGILAWPVTASGVGARVRTSLSTVTPWNVITTGNCYMHGSMKINKCQTLLGAVYSTDATGWVEVFNWDASTGQVTSLARRFSTSQPLYGCEFSPDGSKLYYTSLSGNQLYQLDISTGTVYTDPSSWVSINNSPEMGTLQLGPDGKIYVTNGSDGGSPGGTPVYIGVINNPDNAGAACNYNGTGFLLNAGPGVWPNIDKGISNLGWFHPRDPEIVNNNCETVSFNYNFQTYFYNNITVVPNSEEWDFGEGAGFQTGLGSNPSNLYEVDGNYTVGLRVRDQACNRTWTRTKTISSQCPLPVEWISVKAEKENDIVKVVWETANEVNNNYFIVEKSDDGINFKPIGNVNKATNNNGSFYEYFDYETSNGRVYYRIKQVDLDEKTSLSPVASLYSENFSWSITPNPSENEFNLNIIDDVNGNLVAFNSLGQEVLNIPFKSGLTFGNDLNPGTYLIKIVLPDEVFHLKVIKK